MHNIFKVIITSVFLVFCSCGFSGAAKAQEGMLAHDFSLEEVSGERIRLSDYRGKEEVILLFWASRCRYCRDDLKSLGTKAQELKKYNNIELLGINVEDSRKVVERFLTRYKINVKTLIDTDGDVGYVYDITSIPTYIWVDKEGRIKYEGNSFPDITINKPTGE